MSGPAERAPGAGRETARPGKRQEPYEGFRDGGGWKRVERGGGLRGSGWIERVLGVSIWVLGSLNLE